MSNLVLTLHRRPAPSRSSEPLSGSHSTDRWSHSGMLAGALPVESGTHLYDALQFLFYDTPKVLLLLAGVVFELAILRKMLKLD